MTNNEIYDFIGELAIALYSKKIQISLGSLRTIMLDKGKDYVNNRGMASAVSAAYRRWKVKDPVIYYAIAYTYTDKEGNLAWDEPKKQVIVEKDTDPVADAQADDEVVETSSAQETAEQEAELEGKENSEIAGMAEGKTELKAENDEAEEASDTEEEKPKKIETKKKAGSGKKDTKKK